MEAIRIGICDDEDFFAKNYNKFYISFSIIRINTIHSSILRYRKTLILPRIYHD